MLLRSTLIYAPAITLTRLSALLLLVIATRLIDKTDYGLLTLVATVGEMTDTAVSNWLRIAMLRLGGIGAVSRGSVMRAARILFLTTLASLAVSVVAAKLLVPERAIEFAWAVCAYLVAGAVSRFALTLLQMQQRHSAYSMLELLRAVLQLGLPVAAIFVFERGFLTVSLGSSAAVLLSGLIASIMAFRHIVEGPPRFGGREFLALGIPLIVMALVGFGLNSAERLVLKVYYDAGAVAVFAAAYALARQPIDMVANAVNMGAFPEVVSRFDREGPDAAGRFLSELMALMVQLCLPVAALLVAMNGEITRLVLPPDYHGSVEALFPIIAFGVLAANLTSFVYGSIVHAHKRPWWLIVANSMGSVATIALSLLLIPHFAAVGAALALAGGSLANLCACYGVSRSLTRIAVPWRSIGLSLLVATASGLAAKGAAMAFAGYPAFWGLAAGSAAGGAVFLGLTVVRNPDAAAQLARKLAARLRR